MAGRPWTPEEQVTAEVAAACGVGLRAIARALGRPDGVVSRHLDPAARERVMECQRRYHQANRERELEQSRLYREANREKVRESKRRYCQANREQVRESKRRYHEANRERELERSRLYHEANREQVMECQRRYRQANREQVMECQRRYREANREKVREQSRLYREANREKVREQSRLYREANREKVMERKRRREARIRAANRSALVPMRGLQQLQERFALFGNRCAYCGASEKLTVDHVLALSAGGLDEPGNIAPACSWCNTSKSARPVEAWYRAQPFFSDTRWRRLRKHCPGVEAGQLPLSLAA